MGNFELSTTFVSANEFHRQGSAKHFVADIRIPTLLVSALNDPILTPGFPVDIAREHSFLHLELSSEGGHYWFQAKGGGAFSWVEHHRALEFVGEVLNGRGVVGGDSIKGSYIYKL